MSFRLSLSISIAVWVLIAASAIVTAHEGHLSGHDAVKGGEIRYVNQSSYLEAVSHARQVWNNIRTYAANPDVLVKQPGEPKTLQMVDVDRLLSYAGKFRYDCCESSTGVIYSEIRLAVCWLGSPGTTNDPSPCTYSNPDNRHNMSPLDEKIITAHEFGHALGLGHLGQDQLMDPEPTSTDPNNPSAPAADDRAHYHLRWDP